MSVVTPVTTDTRPDWATYFSRIAETVSVRADCTRRKVGAVIVDSEHRVISTGYNGAPPGEPGCMSAGACPRGKHYRVISKTLKGDSKTLKGDSEIPVECACGNEWPCEQFVSPGFSYDTGKGSCIAVHAEANALLWARTSVAGMMLYCTDEPCDGCVKLMKAARLSGVKWTQGELKFSEDS